MKKRLLTLTFLVLTYFGFGQNQQVFFNHADAFFKTYTKDGRVNYKALREDPSSLNWLVDYLATEMIDEQTEKAYLINAYNILVIDQLVRHDKLVDSPLKIGGFFENKTSMLEGIKVSLNQIENEMIRPVYNDPRVHFVLVCGGLGCPPIAQYAYMPDKLDLQLTYQTELAMNNSDFVYEKADKKTTYLSQIFNWYQGDFGQSADDVVTYINQYRKEPFATSNKVKYYDYDWTINSAEFEIIPVAVVPVVETPQKDGVYTEENGVVKDPEGITNNEGERTTPPSETNPPPPPVRTVPTNEINLQTFTAGSLLGKGKYDFTLFNTLYTENHQVWLGEEISGYRNTFMTHLVQVTYGITESKRINIGFDLNIRNSGSSPDSTYGGLSEAFSYTNSPTSRFGLTSVGARVKVQPFANVSNFSIQSTFYVPTVINPEGNFVEEGSPENRFWADWDRYTWWNQLFIDKTYGKFQVFAELDFLFRFKRYDSQIGMLDMPASVFLSYFPTPKITVYGMTQHVARFTNNINPQDPIVTDWVIPMNYTASGIGFKYQILSNFNVELLYTNFWRGKNTGLGETFNIGLKFLTK